MSIGQLAEAFGLDTSTVNRQTAALLPMVSGPHRRPGRWPGPQAADHRRRPSAACGPTGPGRSTA